MSSIIIDAALMEKLKSQGKVVTLIDPNGEIGGLFVPLDEYALAETCRPKLTSQQLLDRSRKPGARQLSDALAEWNARK